MGSSLVNNTLLIKLLKYVKIKVPVFVFCWAMRFISLLLIYVLYCYIYILLKKPQMLLEKSQFYPMKMAWSSIGFLQLVMKWPLNLSSIGCRGAKLTANRTNVSVSQSNGELYLLETMAGHNIVYSSIYLFSYHEFGIITEFLAYGICKKFEINRKT